MFLGGFVCISVFYNAANQFIVQRCLAAKDEWHARMGVVAVNYLQVLLPLIYIMPGLVAPLIIGRHLAKPDMVFPTLVQQLLPVGARGTGHGRADRRDHVAPLGRGELLHDHRHGRFLPALYQQTATERQAVRFGRITGARSSRSR